ncbi:tetratricopeptide repeat protein [Pseudomonas sp. S2_D10]
MNVALSQASAKGRLAGDFKFFNYSEPGLLSNTIGTIPIITIHGTCNQLNEGFIFSTLEYAKASTRVLDWHRDLAAKIMTGGLVVIGNQLEETDIDTYLVAREQDYPSEQKQVTSNWIVTPQPDEIKADNYRSAGYHVIDATAEEFFNELYKSVSPTNVGEIMMESVPVVKKAVANIKAMTWFKGAFSTVISEVEDAASQSGILRHFLTGADPEWFYIINGAHAQTSKHIELTSKIGETMQANSHGVGVLQVTGPSGSGKTTTIRSALQKLASTYKCIYEFDNNSEIDTSLLKAIIDNLTEKSIFVFYSAAEYYYAISYLSEALHEKNRNFCLFILEERSSEHERNKRQLTLKKEADSFVLGDLTIEDARLIAQKIEQHGLIYAGFSEHSLERRARIIFDKEKGFGGDLLTALFSLTTHENFEKKIYQDYHSVKDGIAKDVLDVIVIINSLGFNIPLNYLAGCVGMRIENVQECLANELLGIIVSTPKSSLLKCRHRIIASYYFDNCIANKGKVGLVVGMLEFLSRQFSVDDIRFHPLPYKMYKEIISYEFLYSQYFPRSTRKADAEKTYHRGQSLFGKDGIFWLHFGRYYKKVGKLDPAIDCFRTGLEYYASFQTRHSLGTALLEKYVKSGCIEESLYSEGIQLLDEERMRRGTTDAYPVTSMIYLLKKILKIVPEKADAVERLKECMNMGLKHFREDPHFMELLHQHFSDTPIPTELSSN